MFRLQSTDTFLKIAKSTPLNLDPKSVQKYETTHPDIIAEARHSPIQTVS